VKHRSKELVIFLFSYNRGKFLENCLESLWRCIPQHSIIIIDDHSDDPYTVYVLSRIGKHCEVILPKMELGSEYKTGGLSNNMNYALNLACERGIRRVLFIQDDMQMVRSLTEFDFDAIERYFDDNQNAMQIQTCFIRELSHESVRKKTFIDNSGTALLKIPELQKGKDNFSDVGIFDVARFFRLFSKLKVGEGENSRIARERGITMGRSLYPFMNWLPYPLSHRGKKRAFTHWIVERIGGAGFHPIEIMSIEESEAFLKRDRSVLPIAERFLRSATSPRHDIWSTGGGEYNLICRGGWRAFCFHSLLKTKRFFFGSKSQIICH